MYRLLGNCRWAFPRLYESSEEGDGELEKIKERKLRELLRSSKPDSASRVKEKDARPLDEPIKVTDETFEDFIHRYPIVVVDCWADWCYPCRILSPIIDALAKEYAGRVVFGKLNVDENRRIPAWLGIMSIPTLLIAKDGQIVERIIGAVPKQAIDRVLQKYL
ncbi:MAG: thioredoxin [Candidatus Bathyarchaeia archaeon]